MNAVKAISQVFMAASMVGMNISLSKIAHNTAKTPIVNVFVEDDDDTDDEDADTEYDVKPTSDIK
jgi:hypothetical protein